MIKIIDKYIDPREVLDVLKESESGSVVMHIGIVRPSSEGKKVTSVEYQMDKDKATSELQQIAGDIKNRWQIQDVSLLRRKGKLALGEIILLAVIAAPHRKDAFEACEYAVERLRGMPAVKKNENYS